MNYRADIDGLRSLAVLPVVAFHMYLSGVVPGGFVGVDIFFVISGFLISNIIYEEISLNKFHVLEFYKRRIKRIFPALYVVYAFCLFSSVILGFPEEAKSLGLSVVASIFFVSNILFYYTSDYFDDSIHNNPLLHTWSLSVEEQFYVLFPILILSIAPLQFRVKITIITLIAIFSLIASEMAVRANLSGAFYLVQYRSWELLLGSILAISKPALPRQRWVTEAIGLGGIFLILASVFLITENMPFPGITAVPPCLGALALIYSGRDGNTIAARILSFSVFRFFGLISYSLYLWHWPIFVFSKQLNLALPKWQILIAILPVSIIIATFSWRYIERPFRVTQASTGKIIAYGIAAMAAMTFISVLAMPINNLIHGPLNPVIEKTLQYESYARSYPAFTGKGPCFLSNEGDEFINYPKENCLSIDSSRRNILLIGDSHAAHLIEGLRSQIPEINFLQATSSGCRPLLDASGEDRCVQLMQYIFSEFLPSHHLDAVILSGRWRDYEVGPAIKTAAAIASKSANRVVISGPIIEFDQSLPRLIALAMRQGVDANSYTTPNIIRKQRDIDASFSQSPLPDNVYYFSIYGALTKGNCRSVYIDGEPRQFDYGHMTKAGSDCVARIMRPQLLQ